MIMKPSEQVPLSTMRLAELLKEAGLPDGVFNIVHGDRDIVEAICDHPDIDAVTFVGSTKVAKIVYRRATSNLKRCLALGGAKNHLIVLPDAHPQMAASNIAASMSGCAGQRCMAASAMVAVGQTDHIIQFLCDEVRKLVVGQNLGSVISKQAKERIERYITEAEKQGAKILVDGRNAMLRVKMVVFMSVQRLLIMLHLKCQWQKRRYLDLLFQLCGLKRLMKPLKSKMPILMAMRLLFSPKVVAGQGILWSVPVRV